MIKKKKICFLVTNIFDLGGVQRVVSVLANELSEYYTIDIVCVSKNVKVDRSIYNLHDSIKVHLKEDILYQSNFNKLYYKIIKVINTYTCFLTSKYLIPYVTNIYYPKSSQKRLINFLKSEEFDIVIGVEGYLSILLAIVSPKLNVKTIGWQHNSFDAYFRNKNRYYWKQDEIFKKNIPNLNKYIVLTKADKEKFSEVFRIDCDSIPNPRSFESDIKVDYTKKQFLAAGRFTYQKGFDMLIESFNIFAKKNSEWNLVIIGDGHLKKQIKETISKYKLDNRIFIYDTCINIKDYFLESSILLLSSRWEGMPMIVLEGLEMGTPIIAYDISAMDELVIHNKEGLLVDKYDINEFAEAMNYLAENSEIRRRFSENCVKKSDDFNITKIVELWNKFLNIISGENE